VGRRSAARGEPGTQNHKYEGKKNPHWKPIHFDEIHSFAFLSIDTFHRLQENDDNRRIKLPAAKRGARSTFEHALPGL
jgi:hypothetical protein